MKKSLFANGVEIIRIENNEYYISTEENGWEYLKEVTRDEFIEELKKISWVCLTSWSKKLKQEYLDLVEYTNKIGG